MRTTYLFVVAYFPDDESRLDALDEVIADALEYSELRGLVELFSIEPASLRQNSKLRALPSKALAEDQKISLLAGNYNRYMIRIEVNLLIFGTIM